MVNDPNLTNPSPSARGNGFSKFVWFCLCVLFIVIRGGYLAVNYQQLEQDPDAYLALAEGWNRFGVFGRVPDSGSSEDIKPTAYRPPGYPFLLRCCYTIQGFSRPVCAAMHLAMGVATCLLTYWIGLRSLPLDNRSLNRVGAVVASILVAFDPILLRQSALIMTETFATFWCVALWALWILYLDLFKSDDQNRVINLIASIVLGVGLGLGSLIRPTTLVWAAVWIIAWVIVDRLRIGSWSKRQITLTAWIGFATIASLVPWGLRNSQQLGKWYWTTTHGGYTLLLANNPILYESLHKDRWSRIWDESRFHQRWDQRTKFDPKEEAFWTEADDKPLFALTIKEKESQRKLTSEVIDDNLANETARAIIKRDYPMFVWSSCVRFMSLWGWKPARSELSKELEQAIQVGYGIIHVLGSLGFVLILFALAKTRPRFINRFNLPVFKRLDRFDNWIPAITLVITLTIVHSVYWSNMRMRSPAIPAMSLLASAAGVTAIGFLFYRRSSKKR